MVDGNEGGYKLTDEDLSFGLKQELTHENAEQNEEEKEPLVEVPEFLKGVVSQIESKLGIKLQFQPFYKRDSELGSYKMFNGQGKHIEFGFEIGGIYRNKNADKNSYQSLHNGEIDILIAYEFGERYRVGPGKEDDSIFIELKVQQPRTEHRLNCVARVVGTADDEIMGMNAWEHIKSRDEAGTNKGRFAGQGGMFENAKTSGEKIAVFSDFLHHVSNQKVDVTSSYYESSHPADTLEKVQGMDGFEGLVDKVKQIINDNFGEIEYEPRAPYIDGTLEALREQAKDSWRERELEVARAEHEYDLNHNFGRREWKYKGEQIDNRYKANMGIIKNANERAKQLVEEYDGKMNAMNELFGTSF